MSDNSTAVFRSDVTSPSDLTSPCNLTLSSPTGYFKVTGGTWFYVVSGLIDHALAIPANVWALYVIITSGGRRSVVELEIITLNMLAMGIFSSLIFIFDSINIFFIENWIMFMCLLSLYMFALSGRSLFQCLICLERYLAVVHPVVFLRYKPLRYRLACCVLIWLLALGYGGIIVSLLAVRVDATIAYLVLFIPLLSIDLFCSLSILRVLRQPGPGDGGRGRVRKKKDVGKEKDREDGGRELKDGENEEQKPRDEEIGKVNDGERAAKRGKERLKEEGKNQQKRRAFSIVSFMMGMLVLNYVPLAICVALKKMIGEVYDTEAIPVTKSFSLMGSCVTAVLYLHRAGRLPCLTPTTRGHQQNNFIKDT